MSIPDVGWAFAFALVIAILLAAFGFWYGGKTERKKLAKERENIDNEKKRIEEQEGENKKKQMELEKGLERFRKEKEGLDEKWALCSLTEEQLYKAMDVVSKVAEERQVPFYTVLDFIRSQTESGEKVSIGTLLSQFNISHTTISLLCKELEESKLLEAEKCSDNEVIYVLTSLGEEVVERFEAFFCFVIKEKIMMEGV